VLERAGLVTSREAGNRRIYSLDPRGIGALHAYFDHFWNQALEGFKAAVEERD
jgi:DNA-binding transcriptional ArsR family regulator